MNFKMIASAALLALLPGCVMQTNVKDEPRQTVRFATARAAQVFYDAYRGPIEKRSISISFGLPYAYRTVPSDNVTFNVATRAADADHNGVITEKEANAFALSPMATDRRIADPF